MCSCSGPPKTFVVSQAKLAAAVTLTVTIVVLSALGAIIASARSGLKIAFIGSDEFLSQCAPAMIGLEYQYHTTGMGGLASLFWILAAGSLVVSIYACVACCKNPARPLAFAEDA